MASAYGIGTYIQGLLQAAKRSRNAFQIVLFGRPENASCYLSDNRFRLIPCRLSPYTPTTHFFFRRFFSRFDLFHFPHYNASFFCQPYVLTIHDLIPLLFPRSLSVPFAYPYVFLWHWLSIKKASHIIAVSRRTKADIQRFFGVEQKKISVVYEGVNEKLFYPVPQKTQWSKTFPYQPYFLYVGGTKFHKNLPVLLKAFARFKKKTDYPHYLVLVGVGQYRLPVRDPALRRKVILVPRVSRKRLAFFYSFAEALVYPSLYEGFGLPPLEAYRCLCPVICARAASLPEINERCCLYFPPQDPEALCAQMIKLVREKKVRETLTQKAFLWVQRFSWDRAFEQTLQIYGSVVR